jgi:hypothetical protein
VAGIRFALCRRPSSRGNNWKPLIKSNKLCKKFGKERKLKTGIETTKAVVFRKRENVRMKCTFG